VAQAQCVFGGELLRTPGGERIFDFMASASTAVTSAVTAMNTAFQTQTSAFIASPSGPEPNQFAGGVWLRGVGGRVDIDSAVSGTRTRPLTPGFETVSCAIQTRNDFTGFQGGIDIGRINLGASGWNVHVGVTGGYFESEVRTQGAGLTRAEVPFIGLYAALVGANGFFLDAQVRADFFRIGISEPSLAVGGATDATGFSFTSSAGYGWVLGNYIIEPSVALVYSNTQVDPLGVSPSLLGRNGPITVPSTLRLSDIESLLGRAGVRVAASFNAGNVSLQPFVAASVWHEFARDTSAAAVLSQPTGTGTMNFNSTRVGTFGQYSIGVAASVPSTGWLGYARFDYRSGENIEGYSVNGGLRYQFAPGPQVAARGSPPLPTKAPPMASSIDSWGGFYLGGFIGGAWAGNVRATEIAPGPGQFAAYNGLGTTTSYDMGSSVIGGLTLGYNYQVGLIVAGMEAEGGYLSLTGSAPFAASLGQDTVSSTKVGDWYALLAGRLGFAVGPALIYGKGGAAFLSVTSSVLDSCFTPPCGIGIVSATGGNAVEVTWAVGGGLEFALSDRWSLKGEYLYLDGTSYTASGPGFARTAGAPPQRFNWSHDVPAIHTAKLGINYRFGSSIPALGAYN
jgi:outer membrane autotransporter protein